MFKHSDAGRAQSTRPQSKNDCMIRAYALMENISFDIAYDFFASKGREPHKRFNTKPVFNSLYQWTPLQAIKGEKRITPERFCQLFPSGKYILRLSHHVVTVIDGAYYDDVSCAGRCVYGFWSKKLEGGK